MTSGKKEQDRKRWELRDTLIHSLVFETFGLRRFTQDSPITPDVWIRFLKLAKWKMKDPKNREEDAKSHRIRLILTPKQTMSEDGRPAGHAGQLAERIRSAILKYPRQTSRHEDIEMVGRLRRNEQEALKPFKIAATSRHVAVDVTFDEMMRILLPLTDWWPKQDLSDTESLEAVLNEQIKKNVSVQEALLQLNNTEFFRFAALTSVVNQLLNEAISEAELNKIAEILAPLERRQSTDEADDDDEEFLFASKTVLPGNMPAGKDTVADLKELWNDYKQIVPPVEVTRSLRETDALVRNDEVSIWSIQLNRPAYRQALPPVAPLISGRGQQSSETVKADAAKQLFSVKTAHLAWGIIDTGIDAQHMAFYAKPPEPGVPDGPSDKRTRVISTLDFTILQDLLSESDEGIDVVLGRLGLDLSNEAAMQDARRKLLVSLNAIRDENINGRQLDWALLEKLIRIDPAKAPMPRDQHGTHVAGILGGNLPEGVEGDMARFEGVCPDIKLYDLRVFNDEPGQISGGDEFTVLAALDYVAWLNRDPMRPAIHGVNLSLAIPYVVDTHACGRTPVCDACDRLVWNGTVVVAAAGNSGFEKEHKQAKLGVGFRGMTITDPGNAQEVITVGATHHSEPHTYGVSYFSSRGPTGDGRMKPDIVAPGEKIRSTVPGDKMWVMDGTSMAAPHVSGVCALLMGRYSELIGEPERIKKILMETATDLGRERHFQGAGLVDALRALQSV